VDIGGVRWAAVIVSRDRHPFVSSRRVLLDRIVAAVVVVRRFVMVFLTVTAAGLILLGTVSTADARGSVEPPPVDSASSEPSPPEPASPDSAALNETLPDRGTFVRSEPGEPVQPVVADVADPAMATLLVLPEAADGWGEVVVGVVEQVSTRPGPPGSGIAHVQEWFVERTTGEIVAIAVPVADADADAGRAAAPRRGTRVEVRAIRIGTLEAIARDGVGRRWPLFAGRPMPSAPMSTGTAAIVAATLLAAGGWFVLRRRLATRGPRAMRPVIGTSDRSHAEEPEPPMDLPADPAEALDALAARADASEPSP